MLLKMASASSTRPSSLALVTWARAALYWLRLWLALAKRSRSAGVLISGSKRLSSWPASVEDLRAVSAK
ncbi:hypothetical protein D3C80_2067380 [compost metagenome]